MLFLNIFFGWWLWWWWWSLDSRTVRQRLSPPASHNCQQWALVSDSSRSIAGMSVVAGDVADQWLGAPVPAFPVSHANTSLMFCQLKPSTPIPCRGSLIIRVCNLSWQKTSDDFKIYVFMVHGVDSFLRPEAPRPHPSGRIAGRMNCKWCPSSGSPQDLVWKWPQQIKNTVLT